MPDIKTYLSQISGYDQSLQNAFTSAYNNFYSAQDARQAALDEVYKSNFWTRDSKRARRLAALDASDIRLQNAAQTYGEAAKAVGLEGSIEPLEDFSKDALQASTENVKQEQSTKIAKQLNNFGQYGSLALDIGQHFTKDPKAYEGEYGNLTSSLDAGGDAFADAAIQSKNPYAMAIGAAYKGMGILNRAIGKGTDGMTKADAILDSNLGFALTGGLGKLNAKWGDTTDKFDVDEDLRAHMGSSYMDTYDDLDDAASVANKKYGFISRGSYRKAQNEVRMAKQRQDILSDINQTSQDRAAAGAYEGLGFRNQMTLNGGFQSMRAAKQGMKLNLDFAHNVIKAQSGIRFNAFTAVNPDPMKQSEFKSDLPDIAPEEGKSPFADLSQTDLAAMGIVFDKFDEDGKLVFKVKDKALADKLASDAGWQTSMMQKYRVPGVVVNYETQNDQQTEQPSNELPQQSGDENIPPVSPPSQATPINPPTQPEQEEPQIEGGEIPNPAENQDFDEEEVRSTVISILNTVNDPSVPNEEKATELEKRVLEAYPEAAHNQKLYEFIQRVVTEAGGIKAQPSNGGMGPINSWERASGYGNKMQEGGSFTFMPYTDEQVSKFKAGGSFNVIPDGALHKNKHHMEGAEGLTKKGIPVVTEEDGKKVQQAEIEVNEIIFRLEVTEKLEKLAKEGTDEAALEAGKLITQEILYNTHDNTGLIKETV